MPFHPSKANTRDRSETLATSVSIQLPPGVEHFVKLDDPPIWAVDVQEKVQLAFGCSGDDRRRNQVRPSSVMAMAPPDRLT
jgi:hypothetical protein